MRYYGGSVRVEDTASIIAARQLLACRRIVTEEQQKARGLALVNSKEMGPVVLDKSHGVEDGTYYAFRLDFTDGNHSRLGGLK